eukprot:TRINITY_DN10619_c0_g1_i2.p1 TRINITY_DN10619_c0_g1~~TRINITY_DN10619_c0_g1_i2.p1  ORF type:complete len:392 (+),score=86.07 TRINITY_DN10619_c0_g1_i2:90-1265(+)
MIPATKCDTRFSIRYKTEHGENVYVMGSIPELGNWSDYKAKLTWTEGHVWTATILLPQQPFEYKYVVYNAHSKKVVWEGGRNRYCDLTGLSSLVLADTWEAFKIHFLLYYPLPEGVIMRINGGPESMGGWNVDGPKAMTLTPEDVPLPNGGKGRAWEFTAIVPVFTEKIHYKYTTYDAKDDVALWEREPTRALSIPEKASFSEVKKMKAEEGMEEARHSDLPVNGIIERFDVNFVSDINYDKIGTYPIFIGAYPQNEDDIKILAKLGVTGVLNVQTDIDMKHRQTDPARLKETYARHGIKMVHYPVHDFNPEDLSQKVRGGAECIDSLINEGRTVYVHCTAGMGRAPSMVIGYLVMYKKMSLDEAYNLVKENRKVVSPNMWALKKALVETK